MADDRIVVRVTRETFSNILEPFAKARELTLTDAADKLIRVGHGRLGALSRYAADMAKQKKAKRAPTKGKKRAAKKASKRTKKVVVQLPGFVPELDEEISVMAKEKA